MEDWQVSPRREFLFWRNVVKGDPLECWPWRGIPDEKGYGHARVAGWATTAHRIAFALANAREKVSSGFVVRHTCDNPICCNPRHLVIGTQADNLADMHARGRAGDCRNFGEQHGRCKLSDLQVLEIRSLRGDGLSQQKIADRLKVSQSQVGRILRGENRHHLGEYPTDRTGGKGFSTQHRRRISFALRGQALAPERRRRISEGRKNSIRAKAATVALNKLKRGLTPEDVLRVVQLRAEGLSTQAIADTVGVTRRPVRAILDGETYVEITGLRPKG